MVFVVVVIVVVWGAPCAFVGLPTSLTHQTHQLHIMILTSLQNYCRLVEVDVDVTLPKLEDYVHLTVQFPSGSRFSGMKAEIPCILEFCSTRPISKICDLIFMENNSGIRYDAL